jgi:hypothetical protein
MTSDPKQPKTRVRSFKLPELPNSAIWSNPLSIPESLCDGAMRKSCMRPSLLLPRNKGVLTGVEFAARSAGISRLPTVIPCLLATVLFSSAVHICAPGESSPTRQFSDVTESAGIKFVPLKGNQGTAINLEEFGPGVCVSAMTVVSTVEVTWPSGGRQVFHEIKADRFYLIEEDRGEMSLQQIHGKVPVGAQTGKTSYGRQHGDS